MHHKIDLTSRSLKKKCNLKKYRQLDCFNLIFATIHLSLPKLVTNFKYLVLLPVFNELIEKKFLIIVPNYKKIADYF